MLPDRINVIKAHYPLTMTEPSRNVMEIHANNTMKANGDKVPDEDVNMLPEENKQSQTDTQLFTKEEWEAERKKKRLVQLAKAREKKKQLRKLDQEAREKGLIPPSILNKTKKNHPLLITPDGQSILPHVDIVDMLCQVNVPVPFPQYLALNPDANQAVKEALGYAVIKAKKEEGNDQNTPQGVNNIQVEAPGYPPHVVKIPPRHKNDQQLAVVCVLIEDQVCEALLDTGAMISLMPLSLVKDLGWQAKMRPTTLSLSFAGRSEERAAGMLMDVSLVFSEELEAFANFAVCEQDDTPLILGYDFLAGANAAVDLLNKELIFSITDDQTQDIVNQVVVETHDGNGIYVRSRKQETKEGNSTSDVTMKIMNVRTELKGAAADGELLATLIDDLVLDPLEVTEVQLKLPSEGTFCESYVFHPGYSCASLGVVSHPSVISPKVVTTLAVGNSTEDIITIPRDAVVGVLIPTECGLQDIPSQMKIVKDINLVKDDIIEVVDYNLPIHDSLDAAHKLNDSIYMSPRLLQQVPADSPSFRIHSVSLKEEVKTMDPATDSNGFDINPNLTTDQRLTLLNVLNKYSDSVFVNNISEIKTLNFEPYSVRLKPEAAPKRCPPYSVPHDAQLWLRDTIDQLMALDKIEPSKSAWAAGTVLIPADISKRHKRKRQKYKGAAAEVKILPIPLLTKPPLKNSSKIYQTTELNDASEEPCDNDFENLQDTITDLYHHENYNLSQYSTGQDNAHASGNKFKGYTAIPPVTMQMTTKKDPYRLCVDYKPLNASSEKDTYPLPNINLLFTMMGKAKYFTIMDAMKGYWQMPLHPDSKECTAFITPFGLYQWKVMPMGLQGAPAAWQRAMDSIFCSVLFQCFLMYIDDGLVYSDNFEDHVKNLDQVLTLAQQVNLSLSKAKCKFGYTELKLLGYIVGKEGFKMDQAKIERINSWPVPTNVAELRTFYGLLQYYRRFIPRFSEETQELNRLLKRNVKFFWDSESQKCFEKCKKLLTTEPVLAHPDFDRDFILYTDASRTAISGILTQADPLDETLLHPIYYGSRTLSQTERGYDVYELEFLAIVYFIKYFRYYLLGSHFKVYTDHQALRHMMKMKEDSPARVVKWLMSIMEYDFDIYYRPGSQNANADALSRRPEHNLNIDPTQLTPATDTIPDYYLPIYSITSGDTRSAENFHGMSKERYTAMFQYLSTLSFTDDITPEIRDITRRTSRYYRIIDDYIYILPHGKYTQPRRLVAEYEVLKILRQHHDHCLAGHQGVNRTFQAISQLYYWPQYYEDIRKYVMSCPICQQYGRRDQPLPLQPIPPPVDGPLSEVMMDFCTITPKDDQTGSSALLVLIDMFSGWIEAYPSSSYTADETIVALFKWVCRFGLPRKIYSDGGPHFNALVVQAMMDNYGVSLEIGPAHHSHRQGKVERAIRSLKLLLKKLCLQFVGTWVTWLPAALYVIRTTSVGASGLSPFFLLHGRYQRSQEGMTSYELEETIANDEQSSEPSIIDDVMMRRLDELIKLHMEYIPGASVRQQQRKDQQKTQYDKERGAINKKLRIGDAVLIKNHAIAELSSNLGPVWLGPYKIHKILGRGIYIISDGHLIFDSQVHADDLKLYNQRPKISPLNRRRWQRIDGSDVLNVPEEERILTKRPRDARS